MLLVTFLVITLLGSLALILGGMGSVGLVLPGTHVAIFSTALTHVGIFTLIGVGGVSGLLLFVGGIIAMIRLCTKGKKRVDNTVSQQEKQDFSSENEDHTLDFNEIRTKKDNHSNTVVAHSSKKIDEVVLQNKKSLLDFTCRLHSNIENVCEIQFEGTYEVIENMLEQKELWVPKQNDADIIWCSEGNEAHGTWCVFTASRCGHLMLVSSKSLIMCDCPKFIKYSLNKQSYYLRNNSKEAALEFRKNYLASNNENTFVPF
ncbi:MAG: hypothetical protein KDK55_06615 [Chlamydiia bacterium]|nr:hypothetical protein [Chlamydiia bacterium]